MIPTQARKYWHSIGVQRDWAECFAVLQPFQDKLETAAGLSSLTLVAGVALLVHVGRESPAALADAIRVASAMSGVPAYVFDAHARFTACFLRGAESAQQQPYAH